MPVCRIPLTCPGESPYQTRKMLGSLSGRLSEGDLRLEVVEEPHRSGELALDSATLVAVISSSVALATAALGLLGKVVSGHASRDIAMMEVSFHDGVTVRIPVGASSDDIAKLVGAARQAEEVRRVQLLRSGTGQ